MITADHQWYNRGVPTDASTKLQAWADLLHEDRLDISHHNADNASDVPELRVALSGQYGGRRVACIHSSVSNHLEFFVEDQGLRFEGSARRRGLSDRLLRLVGIRRGLRPSWSALFDTIRIEPASGGVDASEFESDEYCHVFGSLFSQSLLDRVELHAGSGSFGHFYAFESELTVELFETHVAHCVELADKRDSTSPVVLQW
ncbi:MAG: hypothetical protein AAGF11_07595 [Myxococcota bacterium]